MINFNNYLNTVTKPKLKQINKNVITTLSSYVDNYFSDKNIFKNNYSLYYFDEFVLNTNASEDIFSTIFLEINCPENIKTQTNAKHKNSIIPNLYLTLAEIKKNLTDLFLNTFDSNTYIAPFKYGMKIITNMYIDGKSYNFNYKFIPCLTHYKENKKGVLFYNDNLKEFEIFSPQIFIKNFNKKNKETNNNYTKMILLFKNIYKTEKNTNTLPTEIFETIVYNSPNEFLREINYRNLKLLINYLRNKNIRDYISVDEFDYAFITRNKSLSILYAKNIINVMEKFINRYKK